MERPTTTSEGERTRPVLLDVAGLDLVYGGAVQALKDVTLDVPEGSVVAVLGNNGAGKTTILRAISGTHRLHGGRVEQGSVSFQGQRLDRHDPASIVGMGVVQVPEGRRIFGDLTVAENLRAAARTVRDKASRADSRTRVFDLFPILGERRDMRAGLLSGGEQQMLAIGRALMSSPRLLLLDEPSLGLAPQLVEQIGEIIREIHAQGTSILLVEQNAAMALEIADHAYVLEVGRVALHGPSHELASTDQVRERYLGVSAASPNPAADPVADGMTGAVADGMAGAVADAATPAPAKRGGESSSTQRRDPAELQVEAVSLRFGGVHALDEVSFTVEPGTIHALIGPNGAGKSSCLNVLTGVYRADEGSVRFGDADLRGIPAHQIADLGISRTFQNIALSGTATVADNLTLGRHRLTAAGYLASGLRLPSAVREQRRQAAQVAQVAELIGLADRLDTPVGLLPYGDQKLVELGRALGSDPSLLLLDEPVAGMNANETQRMADLIATLQEELGLSIVIVEHDMAFVMSLATRITVLDFGRCIADGAPEQVQEDPEVLRAYLGTAKDRAEAPTGPSDRPETSR